KPLLQRRRTDHALRVLRASACPKVSRRPALAEAELRLRAGRSAQSSNAMALARISQTTGCIGAEILG
ncbi:MAG: hypothetical protein V3U34_05230, partial [candidate division NC10 bacterium]